MAQCHRTRVLGLQLARDGRLRSARPGGLCPANHRPAGDAFCGYLAGRHCLPRYELDAAAVQCCIQERHPPGTGGLCEQHEEWPGQDHWTGTGHSELRLQDARRRGDVLHEQVLQEVSVDDLSGERKADGVHQSLVARGRLRHSFPEQDPSTGSDGQFSGRGISEAVDALLPRLCVHSVPAIRLRSGAQLAPLPAAGAAGVCPGKCVHAGDRVLLRKRLHRGASRYLEASHPPAQCGGRVQGAVEALEPFRLHMRSGSPRVHLRQHRSLHESLRAAETLKDLGGCGSLDL